MQEIQNTVANGPIGRLNMAEERFAGFEDLSVETENKKAERRKSENQNPNSNLQGQWSNY